MDNYLEIEKVYEKNDSILEFTFQGSPRNENFSIEKIETLLDKCFEKMEVYHDIHLIMTWIITIFRDFEDFIYDNSLQLAIVDNNDKQTYVEFDNKRLTYFETNEILDKNKILNIMYSKPFDFNINVKGNYLSNEESLKNCEEKIHDVIKQISKLENISPLYLQKDDEILYEIYKLFYEEKPNFNDKDINIRFETMFLILNDFNRNFYRNGSICFKLPYESSERSISLELEQAIERLAFFIENSADEFKNITNDNYKLKIKCIGENIKKYTNNQIENLKKVNSILDTRYCMSLCGKATEEDVANRLNYAIEDVNSCFQLIKTIDNQISKDN